MCLDRLTGLRKIFALSCQAPYTFHLVLGFATKYSHENFVNFAWLVSQAKRFKVSAYMGSVMASFQNDMKENLINLALRRVTFVRSKVLP